MNNEHEIVENLIENRLLTNGLYYGNAGRLLALNNFKLSSNANDKLISKIEELTYTHFSGLFDSIEDETESYGWGFSNGLSGQLFSLLCIDEYNKEKLCDDDNIKLLSNLVYKKLIGFESLDYDLFNGEIGIILFLIKSNFLLPTEYLINLNNRILKQIERDQPNKINFGLAHGIPSLIILFSKLYIIYKKDFLLKTLNDLVRYVLIYNKGTNPSFFPSTIENNEPIYRNRMAWCYGDLGICLSLVIASKVLKDSKLSEFCYSILASKNNNNNLTTLCITESSFCHGIYGVAYLFYKASRYLNNNPTLNNISKEWFYTANKFNFDTYPYEKDKLTLIKIIQKERENHPHKDVMYSLLEGMSGELLVKNTIINKTPSNWDQCFLL